MPHDRAQVITTLTLGYRRAQEVALHLEAMLRELHREPDTDALDRIETHGCFVEEKLTKIRKATSRALGALERRRVA